MLLNVTKARILICGLIICMLNACYHPPYNNFQPTHKAVARTVTGAAVGAGFGAIVTSTGGGAAVGALIGGAVGAAIGISKDSKNSIIRQLRKEDIQFIQYGDTMTLIVPTDKYFRFESPRLNEVCYPGLINIIRLLRFYPRSPIYVAGFTDNVGSNTRKKLLSQAQAETMLTFLWANNIAAQRLKDEGYGDKNEISDNMLIHGSAQNRRIEIQWLGGIYTQECCLRKDIWVTK